MKYIYILVAFLVGNNLVAQNESQNSKLKWPRSFEKSNLTMNIGFGNFQPEAFQLASYNNYEGLQGDAQGRYSSVFTLGYDVHERDNYTIGLHYSNFSSQSGKWVDPNNFHFNQFKLVMHQVTAKTNFGWYNNKNFGGMLYSGYAFTYRFINKEVIYPDAIWVSNPAEFPYAYSSFASHITIIGLKGRFTKEGHLGTYCEIGIGNLGIINYGLNYTF